MASRGASCEHAGNNHNPSHVNTATTTWWQQSETWARIVGRTMRRARLAAAITRGRRCLALPVAGGRRVRGGLGAARALEGGGDLVTFAPPGSHPIAAPHHYNYRYRAKGGELVLGRIAALRYRSSSSYQIY